MLRGLADVITVHDAEDDRNENERGDGGEDQSTDHGATQRRILLTAIAEKRSTSLWSIVLFAASLMGLLLASVMSEVGRSAA